MLLDLARMEAMVTQILESVRLERGRVDLRREPVELARCRARVVAQLEERARKERITITADIARGLYVLSRSARARCGGAQPAGECDRGGGAGRRRHDPVRGAARSIDEIELAVTR